MFLWENWNLGVLYYDTAEAAIAWIAKNAKGRKESEMIIAEATALLKKAEELAASGK